MTVFAVEKQSGDGAGRSRIRLTTRWRLTLVFTLITIVSAALLFALAFFTVYRTLQQDDIRAMQNRLLGYWAQYQTGGLDLLRGEIDEDTGVVGERPMLVRLATKENRTVFLRYPEIWRNFNVGQLEQVPLDPERLVVLNSSDFNYMLEVGGIWLSNSMYLQIGLATDWRVRLLTLFQRNFLLLSLAIVLAGSVAGWGMSSRALRPIAQINRTAQEIIRTGELHSRIPVTGGGGDLENLVDIINRMLERIERLFGAMRNTMDMVAHDLRTPLTRIRGNAELALRSDDEGRRMEALGETVEQADEILRFVNTMLDITEAESGIMALQSKDSSLREILNEVVDLYELVAEDAGVTLVVRCEEELRIPVDRNKFRQAVANLVDNGIRFSSEGGKVTIRAQWGKRETNRSHSDAGKSHEARGAIVEVSDTGVGISENERDKVWDRLFRGSVQPARQGFGLGLSFVKAIVEAHNGWVELESTPGKGSTFRIVLPPTERA